MSAASIIHPPMSRRDRRHYAKKLHKAEQAQGAQSPMPRAHQAADHALFETHRLDCEAWSARQFVGGPTVTSETCARGADKEDKAAA
ncbi:hypothetical protein [Bradyrhizobium sp. Tv2a-2]|uniref:hypothetical protein n=1 Tax=Bradyrhizobium sp. Tv2a-2 TaxID=113395 RepID=UPI0004160727|nr:hypothetical protein [Bradyrhizobium sp. Tv2a-2]